MELRQIVVYDFDELSAEAKAKAISDHIKFWLDTIPYEDMTGNLKRVCDEAESMQTPWFTGSYIYEYCYDEIVNDIKLNGYKFYENGMFA